MEKALTQAHEARGLLDKANERFIHGILFADEYLITRSSMSSLRSVEEI